MVRTSIDDFRRVSSGLVVAIDGGLVVDAIERAEDEGIAPGSTAEDVPCIIEAALTKSDVPLDDDDDEDRFSELPVIEEDGAANLSDGRATQYRCTRRIASVVVSINSAMSGCS